VNVLDQSVAYVKGIGESRKAKLESLGISTVEDLLYYFPYRYEDLRIKDLTEIKSEERVTVKGEVYGEPILSYYTRKKSRLTVRVIVGQLVVTAVWFNQPYLKERLRRGTTLYISGKYDPSKMQITVSETSFSDTREHQIGALQPVYSVTGAISVKWLRKVMTDALQQFGAAIDEILPYELVERYRLMSRREAISAIHFPENEQSAAQAKRRLIYEELFLFQLKLQVYKALNKKDPDGVAQPISLEKVRQFVRNLPFALTDAQKRVIKEILDDMQSPVAMNRLLQGDVGSGKTIVAAIALYATVTAGFQGTLMVPTEILAEQHYQTLKALLEPYQVQVALLSGSSTQKQRRELLGQLQIGLLDVLVGTHALIQEDVHFHNLGLVITDEQHRFGVNQRRILREKGRNPDVLFMTATPIPRTLAITAFGDMEVSTIDELPSGRKPVETYWTTPAMWNQVLQFIERELKKGRQAYVICPLIEESEKLDLQNAVDLHMQLAEAFPKYSVGLMHGKLSNNEKEEVMKQFIHGKIHLLVSTTVVEVGVNVPNATLMVIYDAERFGLAQLHQLRGRVGRGAEQSYCILVADPKSESGKERMRVMTETNDGFEISRKDLEIRGPGDFFGTKQSGMPDFKLADVTTAKDFKILEIARQDAERLTESEEFWKEPRFQPLRQYLRKSNVLEGKILD
jgi:ATP-dependent DNA helicase RecG